MLQMNCPKCSGVVKSPFLAELPSIQCSHCHENVPVKDVFVVTKGYTMHRDDLLNRINRYQVLLKEVDKERQLAAVNDKVSEKTRRSINQFYSTLQELLAGARKNFRLEIPHALPVQMNFLLKQVKGQLKNISSEGASLKFFGLEELPKNRTEVELTICIADNAEPLSILARIIWIKKLTSDEGVESVAIGVNFMNLDDKFRTLIWNFIVENSSTRST